MIPEPQRTYLLELLAALGPAGDGFVVAGAQAMKFVLGGARATRDIDFILDVLKLRSSPLPLRERLEQLGYTVIQAARNFQFEKAIPGSAETMRIEFMAPEEFKRTQDFRVDIQPGLHARACTGGSVALAESDVYPLSGTLPSGEPPSGQVRVTRPHSLVMLKLLALRDRYENIRGVAEAEHDREEARTHAGDIIAVVSARSDLRVFKEEFANQFALDPKLGVLVLHVLDRFFRESTAPGLLLYEESLAANLPATGESRAELRREIERAHQLMLRVLPSSAFFALSAAVDDTCNAEANPALAEAFLSSLLRARLQVSSDLALQLIPSEAFGGAFRPHDTFIVSAADAIQQITPAEGRLAREYLRVCALTKLGGSHLKKQYSEILC